MRSILITNDDGIMSGGILRLARAALAFGEVFLVAPGDQRSALSHSITLHRPIEIIPRDFPLSDVKAFSCSGSPGDCVRIGALSLMDRKPDVVLSGINYGYNVATDIQYSATAGAAFEAGFQGCIGIALSEEAGDRHGLTDEMLPGILSELIDQNPGPGCIWNVNFPSGERGEGAGILYDRFVSACSVFSDSYDCIEKLPGGGRKFMVNGRHQTFAEPGSDYDAVLRGFVSVGRVRNVGSVSLGL